MIMKHTSIISQLLGRVWRGEKLYAGFKILSERFLAL